MPDNHSNGHLAIFKTSRHFDTVSDEWISKGQNPKDYFFRKIVLAAEVAAKYLSPKARCLDIGCASGHLCQLFHEIGCDVYGIDIAPKLISAVRTRMASLGVPEDHFNIYDGMIPPFPDGTFDLVSVIDVIPYIKDQPLYFKELHRLLKPGGMALVTNINPRSFFVIRELLKRTFKLIPGRTFWRENRNLVSTGIWSGGFLDYSTAIQARSADDLEAFLVRAGFRVIAGFDMHNIALADRNPLRRKRFSAHIARNWGWNHVGLFEKKS